MGSGAMLSCGRAHAGSRSRAHRAASLTRAGAHHCPSTRNTTPLAASQSGAGACPLRAAHHTAAATWPEPATHASLAPSYRCGLRRSRRLSAPTCSGAALAAAALREGHGRYHHPARQRGGHQQCMHSDHGFLLRLSLRTLRPQATRQSLTYAHCKIVSSTCDLCNRTFQACRHPAAEPSRCGILSSSCTRSVPEPAAR